MAEQPEKQKELYEVCREGNLAAVKQLIEVEHVNPDYSFGSGWPHTVNCAIQGGHSHVVEYLIEEAGADPGTKKTFGFGRWDSPIYHAAIKGDLEMVKYLVEKHNVSPRPAFFRGKVNVIRYLVEERKVDIYEWDGWSSMQSPFHKVCAGGDLEAIKYLVEEHHADPMFRVQPDGPTAIDSARDYGHSKGVLPYLLSVVAITTHPTNQDKRFGEEVTFSVVASGEDLQYQWKKDGQDVLSQTHPGATTPNLHINAVLTEHEGSYSCVVRNNSTSVESRSAALRVENPAIIKHPSPVTQTKYTGDEVAFTITAIGAEPLTYQWKKNDENIVGATTPTLYIKSAILNDEGSYNCTVTNEAGTVVSEAVTLKIVSPPSVIQPPSDVTKLHGEDVQFRVEATGSGHLSYQWLKDGMEITPDSHPYCEDAYTDTLRISAVLSQYEGEYSCVVSNDISRVESKCAQLSVVRESSSLFKPLSPETGEKVEVSRSELPPLGPPKVHPIDSKTGQDIIGPDKGFTISVKPQENIMEEKICVRIQSFSPFSDAMMDLPSNTKMFSPVYHVSTSSRLNNTEATIQHYANMESRAGDSDVIVLYSESQKAPFLFQCIPGGKVSDKQNVYIIPMETSGRYAIGASSERPENYTVYLVYPVPHMSEECMSVLFSVSYSHHAFEKHLVDIMKQTFPSIKFEVGSHTVTIAKDCDGFELVIPEELKKRGLTLKPTAQSNLKILLKDLQRHSAASDPRSPTLPPSVMVQLEGDFSENVEFNLKVGGVSEDISGAVFTLHAKPSPQKSPVPEMPFISQTILTEPIVTALVKVMADVAGKWRLIGRHIKFNASQLADIDSDLTLRNKGPQAYFEVMIKEWSAGKKGVQPACLEVLEKALQNSGDKELCNIAASLRKDLEDELTGKRPPSAKAKAGVPKEVGSDFEEVPNFDPKIATSAVKLWKLPRVHDDFKGTGVVIAILDSGLNKDHAAFKAAYESGRITGRNFVPGEKPEDWTVYAAHGSMSAYVTGGDEFEYKLEGEKEERIAMPGVAPDAQLLICRVGSDRSMIPEAIKDALQWLVSRIEEGEKVDIVSMSFGMEYNPENRRQVEIEEKIAELHRRKVVCIASCGNYGNYKGGDISSLFPACLDEVISVGALDAKGHQRLSNSVDVDVYAPGENIISPSVQYSVRMTRGSSCAAPAIAGLIALIMEYINVEYKNEPESLKVKKYHKALYYKLKMFREKLFPGKSDLLKPYDYFAYRLKWDID